MRYDSSNFKMSGDLCCWKKFQNGSIAAPAPIIILSRPGCNGTNFVTSYTPMPYVTHTLSSLQATTTTEKEKKETKRQFQSNPLNARWPLTTYDECFAISFVVNVGKSLRTVLWHSNISCDGCSACTNSWLSSENEWNKYIFVPTDNLTILGQAASRCALTQTINCIAGQSDYNSATNFDVSTSNWLANGVCCHITLLIPTTFSIIVCLFIAAACFR